MNLVGWPYVGRVISDDLNDNIVYIADFLSNSGKVMGRTWPGIQQDLGNDLDVASGQIRTIKRSMEELGIIRIGALNHSDVPSYETVFTDAGKDFVGLYKIKKELESSNTHDSLADIEGINEYFRLWYLNTYKRFVIQGEEESFHPFGATLEAIKRNGYLDYWEWYLLNTVVLSDSSRAQDNLSGLINDYRNHRLSFEASDIVTNKLSHSYIMSNFMFTGLIVAEGAGTSKRWYLDLSHRDNISEVIGPF